MEPVRTCVGCRARAPRAALLRVVDRDGILVADEKAVLPGRGAWVHRTNACVTVALKRRAFGRALRVSGQLDIQGLDLSDLDIPDPGTQTIHDTNQRKG